VFVCLIVRHVCCVVMELRRNWRRVPVTGLIRIQRHTDVGHFWHYLLGAAGGTGVDVHGASSTPVPPEPPRREVSVACRNRLGERCL